MSDTRGFRPVMMKNAFRFRLVRRLLFIASLIATTLLLSNGGTKAADLGPGQLDPTFGNGGKIIGQGGSAIAVQPDGKIVVAQTFASWLSMEFAVTRLLPDGTVDATFGSGSEYGGPGHVITDFSGRDDYVGTVMLLPDGTIVVGGSVDCSPYGTYECGFGLAFYSPYGAELFKSTTFFSTSAGVNSLALQSGKIVAAGGPYLVRYDDGGVVEVTTNMAWTNTVEIQPDGKLVASGWCRDDLGTFTSCIARFGADDSLDTTFGVNGRVTDETIFGALTLQPDGKLIAAGARSGDFVLVRYNPDGSLDTSFGAEGRVSTDFGNDDRASAVALQADGKIIAAGTTVPRRFALARYDAGGSLDYTFGSFGKVTTDFADRYYKDWEGTAVTVQPDGKIIAAGFGQWPGVYGVLPKLAMARYLASADQQSPLASLRIAPTSVISGNAATGTITLAAAQTSDVSIALSTTDTALATVPPSVTVPAGSTSGTFDVSTIPVFSTTGVELRASLGDATRYASLLLYAQTSVRDVLAEPSVVGGNSAAGTVYLTRAPGSMEAVEVTLMSSHPAIASVPLGVTIPVDGTFATFPIHTTVVDTATPVTISATYGASTRSAVLSVTPVATLAFLSLDPTSVTGGTLSTGTVTLSPAAPAGGAVVALASSDAAFATVPASVAVAAGATSAGFTVSTNSVSAPIAVTISATYGGATRFAVLSVTPAATVSSLSLDPTSVIGGTSSTGTVTLSAVAPAGGAVVALLSSDDAVATVPASVTVAAGATSAGFTVSTNSVSAPIAVTISATYGGATRSAVLTVTPVATLALLSLDPTSVRGGTPSTGTVTLSAVAPAAGAVVALSSRDAAVATVPASVTVAAGATSGNFTVSTSAACASATATISATYGGLTRSRVLTVTPVAADTVAIQRADYFRSWRRLLISAMSSTSTATLQVLVTSSGELIGTLNNNGGGTYGGQFIWPVNPRNVTVRSSSCGSATRQVKSK